ncbi:MAG: hypothetical protein ACRD0X_04805 [Thermoanaerobaculia bacterium]
MKRPGPVPAGGEAVMQSHWIGLVFAALGLAATPIAAETVSATIGGAERVYTYVANASTPSRAVLMWAKRATDVDVSIFVDVSPDDPVPVAQGIGEEDRVEVAEHGAIRDALYYVVVSRFSGPNSKFFLNVGTAGSELLSSRGDDTVFPGLRYLGSLRALAAADTRFAKIQDHLAATRAAKLAHRAAVE